MRCRKRGVLAALALVAAAGTLPGCLVAVGSTGSGGNRARVTKLEDRMTAAEKRLGIPAAEVNQ